MKQQTSFAGLKRKYEFGGSLLTKARNRHARPISSREPMHIVLKSSQAKGRNSFGHSRNVVLISETLQRHCVKYGIKLISFSNNFSHLHMLLKFPSKAIYLRFIRSLTAAIAMLVTGARKLKQLAKRFWDRRPFTRIIRGRRAFVIAQNYIRLNQLEAEGVIPHRENRLKDVRADEWSFFKAW